MKRKRMSRILPNNRRNRPYRRRLRNYGLLPPGQCTVVKERQKSPALKSQDILSPHVYTFRATVFVAGQQTDCAETRFGFRTLGWSVEDGFLLNGRRVQLQGVCCHQDYGLTGKAMPDRVHRYRLRRLKEMGANAYRAAHYPPAEASMDDMDDLGILCMDESAGSVPHRKR